MPKNKKIRQCEYQLPNCQTTADTQISLRIGVDLDLEKYWACQPCGEIVKRELNLKESK